MSETVSIIIPCFNREQLVGCALESALNQSYRNVEIIVVDDGSTDGSWQVIEAYGRSIKAVRIANGGAPRARNHGLRLATGSFIKFLDSDDLLPPDSISQLVDAATKETAKNAFVVGQAISIDSNGELLPLNKYNYRDLEPGRPIPLQVLLSQPTSVSMPLFLRSSLREVGGFREDLILSEDYELMLRLYFAGYRPVYRAIQTIAVREHSYGRITADTEPEAFVKMHLMYRELCDAFDAYGVELAQQERVAFAQLIWLMGREAARHHYEKEAGLLFSLAAEIGRKKAFVGHPILKALYRFFDPVLVENAAMKSKSIIARMLPRGTKL